MVGKVLNAICKGCKNLSKLNHLISFFKSWFYCTSLKLFNTTSSVNAQKIYAKLQLKLKSLLLAALAIFPERETFFNVF